MNNPDLVSHLANLLVIIDHHERAGTTKNTTLLAEYDYCQQDLYQSLEKDHETRKRDAQRKRSDEGRAFEPSSEPGRSEPDRESRRADG